MPTPCRILAPLALLLSLGAACAEQVTVGAVKAGIRAEQAFHSAALAFARRGEQLQLLQRSGDWVQVRQGKTTGWVHGSQLTQGSDAGPDGLDQVLNSLSGQSSRPQTRQGFSQDEVTLAGKGFDNKVEQRFRQRYPGANFAAVDRMEKHLIEPRQLQQFASQGQLLARQEQPGKSTSGGNLLQSAGSSVGRFFQDLGSGGSSGQKSGGGFLE